MVLLFGKEIRAKKRRKNQSSVLNKNFSTVRNQSCKPSELTRKKEEKEFNANSFFAQPSQ